MGEFIEKLIREAVDIRNITGKVEDEKKGREVAVKILEENLLNRLKLRGDITDTIAENFE